VREYLGENLEELEAGLSEFFDTNGRRGTGYATSLGGIDILAEDNSGGLVVVGIVENADPLAACGTLLGQTAWVREHLANGRKVRGLLVTRTISERLNYAVSEIPSIRVCTYELSLNLRHRKSPHTVPGVRSHQPSTAVAPVCVVS